MNKYKITTKDVREISKLITGIVGRQFGVSYECNLWVQPKANEPYTTFTDSEGIANLTGQYYEDIMDEDSCLDCHTYHYEDMLENCTYVSIKRKNGKWSVNKYY